MSAITVKQGDSAKIPLTLMKGGSPYDVSGADNIKVVVRVAEVEVSKFSKVVEANFGALTVSGAGNNIVTLLATRELTSTWPTGKLTATVLVNTPDVDFPDTGATESFSFNVGTVLAADAGTLDEILP